MNAKDIFEYNKIRSSRNNLSLIAEQMGDVIVSTENCGFTPEYTVKFEGSKAIINEIKNKENEDPSVIWLCTQYEKSISEALADCIATPSKRAVDESSVAFLSLISSGKNKDLFRSVQLANVFNKANFNFLDFVNKISSLIYVIVSCQEFKDHFKEQDNPIPMFIKLICSVVGVVVQLIKDMSIVLSKEQTQIIYVLLYQKGAFSGISTDQFFGILEDTAELSDCSKEKIDESIKKLEDLGIIKLENDQIRLEETIIL